MDTLVTNGIKISVETFYQEEYSRPLENKYIFAYRITVENMTDYTVQLMRRHWYIIDSNGLTREVEGEGVIGQQPTLSPGEMHQYVSWSHFFTEIGKMHGYYIFRRDIDDQTFKAAIPEFHLMTPFKMN
ncbi:MAG: Co2+/Mg2+ efflux protein ApaG [Saprospiraceae bacterium]|nr:Co2+/Mg2+ efflux protein ApaG [Saprospiraceae bacterium]